GKYVNLGPPPQDHYVDDGSGKRVSVDIDILEREAGKLVYLGPDQSSDIYTLVQREVYLDHPEFGDLVHPLERKLAKTPTMTKFYGCGSKKMAKQINGALLGLGFETDKDEPLADAFRAAIKKIAPKAIEVFEWVQKLATICANEKAVLRCTTK